jgi:hypothetical protein
VIAAEPFLDFLVRAYRVTESDSEQVRLAGGCKMAWYQDKKRKTYVATYKDEKSLQKEVEEASKHGWRPQDTVATGGHINVGRTTLRVLSGVGLLFGASRSKDKITIIFVRE